MIDMLAETFIYSFKEKSVKDNLYKATRIMGWLKADIVWLDFPHIYSAGTCNGMTGTGGLAKSPTNTIGL